MPDKIIVYVFISCKSKFNQGLSFSGEILAVGVENNYERLSLSAEAVKLKGSFQ